MYHLGGADRAASARTRNSATQATAAGTSGVELASAPPAASVLAAPSTWGAGRKAGVRYRFDDWKGGPVADEAGLLPLKPRTAAGGTVTSTPHANGHAVRFPPRCPRYGSEDCARAILQSGPAEFLNPGRRSFRYGAAIKMAPSETSNGANVVQKGFAIGQSQFKLQVDGSAGRPSCVLVGASSPTILAIEAPVTVADGQWHQIDCARRDDMLTIAVDSRIRAERNVPAVLSIVNADPLCVGGKGTSANNDQFAGVIDDVYVSIGQ